MGCKSADAFVRRQAELIRHNAQKINDLIYMLNEFQSTDPVDGSDDIEMLDVSRTAGGIAQTFADYAGENRIAYRTAVGSGVLFPSVRNILMMIFNILLSNAFRRTEPGGEVSVSVGICSVPRPDGAASGAGEETSGAAERLRIEVSNRGVELDAGQIELIFDRYKLLNHLGALSRQGVSGQNITGTMEKVEGMMSSIVQAFEKQLDSLFGDQAMDISTDITVLDNMMAREGLTGGDAVHQAAQENPVADPQPELDIRNAGDAQTQPPQAEDSVDAGNGITLEL